MYLNRRDLLKLSGLTLLGSHLSPARSFGSELFQNKKDPHFFMSIVFPFGWDNTYLFDARPLEMTTHDKLQNYIGEEPSLWTDSRGVSTFATKLVEPLKEFQTDFSILNGVHMSSSFDGHGQNTNFYFTGSAFGGPGYIPLISQTQDSRPLEYVQVGRMFAALTNKEKSIQFSAASASKLTQNIQMVGEINTDSRVFRYVRERAMKGVLGPGLFSEGLRRYISGIDEASVVSSRLKTVSPPEVDVQEFESNLKIATEYFKNGLATGALVSSTSINLDTHAANDARKQPELYASVVSRIRQVLKHLKETPFDDSRSFLDVTTFVISSEFSRTMKQRSKTVDDTGTDHNPLTNTFLVGGKGIQPNLVLGASDFQKSDETLSGAHLEHDEDQLKIMGRPFDFDTGLAQDRKPEKYEVKDYLNCNSIVNTLFELYGVESKNYRRITRDGSDPYRTIKQLLS